MLTTNIPKPMHPNPDKMREMWLNLNGKWDFSFDTEAFDRQIVVPYSWSAPLSEIAEDRNGTAYYRRTVKWDQGEDNRLFIIFGAVDYSCEVYLNGRCVGSHVGGYNRFECELTEWWNRDGENEIKVKVTDYDGGDQTNGKQGYGQIRGIWQTVYLEARPQRYIDSFKIVTKTTGEVYIDVKTWGKGEIKSDFGGVEAVAKDSRLSFIIPDPKLWDCDNPNLYEGTISLTYEENGKTYTDTVNTYFGIREIGTAKFDTADGSIPYITLNGKPLYINGTLDQSYNPDGYFTLPTHEDEREEIMRMKRIGLNMARIHIKAEEPLKLYWADKLGLLIMEDIPNFWGQPTELARLRFEKQMYEQINRDINHPSIFYWVIFNETWGLFTDVEEDGKKERRYLPETQEWVRKCYRDVKLYDPTRLVEDNSPCNRDHVETDVNTWHYYSNGFRNVRWTIKEMAENGKCGSTFNFIAGNKCADVPVMNSECGNVWGIEGSAGDSDLAWHYKYMMNEYRLYSRMNGFIFTEFHDVINEFNGYYRIDNTEKDFGLEYYVPGMTVNDLHSQDFLAVDIEPMKTLSAGACQVVPLYGSSFVDKRHGKTLSVKWKLRSVNPVCGDIAESSGEKSVLWQGWGTFSLGDIEVTMPERDTVAILELYLCDGDEIIMRNFVVFDVKADTSAEYLTVEPKEFEASGFDVSKVNQQGNKVFGGKSGAFTHTVSCSDIPNYCAGDSVEIIFEASSKQLLTKDLGVDKSRQPEGFDWMHGYKVDRGANLNAYYMTTKDAHKFPSEAEVIVNGTSIGKFSLENNPADSRGCLSWHYQQFDHKLDEAGSYGYLCKVTVPAELLCGDSFELKIAGAEGGLALYGRNSGRYPCGVIIRAVK